MSDGGQDPSELFRLWFDRQAGAFAADALSGGAWDQAEALYRAWNGLAGGAGVRGGRAPFDPGRWMGGGSDNEASMTVVRGVLSMGGLGQAPEDHDPGAWDRYSEALGRAREIVGAAWLAAFREFAERARREADDARRHGRKPPDWQDMLKLWQDIGDDEFAALHRSDDFIAAQAELLSAGLACRRTARARIEQASSALGLPTRAEMDALTEEVAALRSALETLKAGR